MDVCFKIIPQVDEKFFIKTLASQMGYLVEFKNYHGKIRFTSTVKRWIVC